MTRFPHGYVARLRPDLLRTRKGLLMGGSPLRAMRLSATAQTYVHGNAVVVRDRASAELAARLLDSNMADPEPHGLTVYKSDITVVVPVRDRSEQLDRCLGALADLECVVVDDASRDRAAVATVAERHGAQFVPLDHNVGPAAARNLGLARVRSKFVAFVDSDVEVSSSALLELSQQFADRRLALVGPQVRGISRAGAVRWFERYEVAASSLDLGRTGASVQPGAAVAWLPGACMLGRTEAIRQIDGFSASMRVGEDVDLVWRLVRSGATVRFDPSQSALHDTRTSVSGWLGRKFTYGTGGASLAERHGDWTAPAILAPGAALGAWSLLLRRPWSIPVVGAVIVLNSARLAAVTREPAASNVVIAVRGMGWAVRQESSLLLRHWWPATLLGCAVSRSVRRAVLTSLCVDAVVAVSQQRGIGAVELLVARRLDDAAYGAGLWAGAAAARDGRCLWPRRAARPKSGHGQRRLADGVGFVDSPLRVRRSS